MKKLFEKYVDWRILAHFLRNPTTRFYIKELSRKLGISPRSALEAAKAFWSEGILTKEEIGQAHMYKLNNELPVVKALKKTYILTLLHDHKVVWRFCSSDEDMISLVLYGSYSSGEYDEKSDLDLLVVTPAKKEAYDALMRELEKALNIPISLEALTLTDWKKLSKTNNPFYLDVARNHTVLHGSGIE